MPDWKAPADDGATLLWPGVSDLVRQTQDNHSSLRAAAHVSIQNSSLPTLRSLTRIESGQPDDQLLIATGHQTELHHPGVWAKNLLMSATADRLAARALHIAVDTDAPKHLNLRWPGESKPQSEPLSDDPAMAKAAWSGQLAPPTPRWIALLSQQTAGDPSLDYALHGRSMLPEFFQLLAEKSKDSKSLDEVLVAAMQLLDRQLGLRYDSVIASSLWAGTGFLTFAHHVLARARAFTSDYNGALSAYRQREGIDSTMRPMPDLFTGHGAVEAPFWLDNLADGTRIRPSVFDDGGGFRLDLVDGEQFFFDPTADAADAASRLSAFLNQTRMRLSPRALTLTMFVRLLLADQFVHGIGGGRYDQVTDDIIRRHFKLEPPAFSVTTATLIYPGAAGRERVCLPCLWSEGHTLRHRVLGEQKRRYLDQIEAMPRKSTARADAFATMQRDRHASIITDPAVTEWQARLSAAEVQHDREKTLFDRELFYAVQPRDRLTTLIDHYRRQVTSAH